LRWADPLLKESNQISKNRFETSPTLEGFGSVRTVEPRKKQAMFAKYLRRKQEAECILKRSGRYGNTTLVLKYKRSVLKMAQVSSVQ
jgi:hypothetical protein